MPIYEYRCGHCRRKVSIFFPSFSAAESRTAAGEVRCPRCDSADLTRLMSRAFVIRGGPPDDGGDDDGDLGGEDFSGDDDPMMKGLEGLDDEDPRAVARWARQMKEQMGSEMDLGPEFDQALARIEAGEDPDKVMDDIDPDALGGPGGEEEEGDFDEGDLGDDDSDL